MQPWRWWREVATHAKPTMAARPGVPRCFVAALYFHAQSDHIINPHTRNIAYKFSVLTSFPVFNNDANKLTANTSGAVSQNQWFVAR